MRFRHILIAAPSTRVMRWHQLLRDNLARRWPEAEIAFHLVNKDDAQTGAVSQLLALERLLLRRMKPTLCDRIEAAGASPDLVARADVIIDLAGDIPAAGAARVMRPLYDGASSDQRAVAALLQGAAPTLAVEDAATGAILVQGLPSLEAADGLTGGLEAVYSRLCALIEKALALPDATAGALDAPQARRPPPSPAAFLARNIAFQCARQLYHLCCHSPHWRIGWRFVEGPGVIDAVSLGGEDWRVAPDQRVAFSADPFPIEWRGVTGFFFESLDYRDGVGEIWFQRFGADGPEGPPVPALKEKWHLSYPFLIKEGGALYMIPEASLSGAITLYRCVDFPGKWEPVARLVDDVEAADATVFQHGGRYWMTSVTRDGYGGYSDTLAIHHAPSLFGPWERHNHSPVVIDPRFARPAGAVVSRNGALLRPVQDCARGYGKAIAIMRIDALDLDTFRQTLVGNLTPGGKWPGARLHTVNRAGRLEVIDGAVLTPKFIPLRRAVHAHIDKALIEGQEGA